MQYNGNHEPLCSKATLKVRSRESQSTSLDHFRKTTGEQILLHQIISFLESAPFQDGCKILDIKKVRKMKLLNDTQSKFSVTTNTRHGSAIAHFPHGSQPRQLSIQFIDETFMPEIRLHTRGIEDDSHSHIGYSSSEVQLVNTKLTRSVLLRELIYLITSKLV